MKMLAYVTGKHNGFPILDILGYLKNTHKNPKFGRVREIPISQIFPTLNAVLVNGPGRTSMQFT